MDTKGLRYFLTVAEYRNFTKAAEHLYMTQSALSHNIADLEAELGTKLFHRTTRSVSLTPSGILLYKSASELILRLNQIQQDIREADSGMSGELVIGYIVTSFIDAFSEVTMRFHAKYPDIKLRYVRKNEGPLMEIFSRGGLDFAVIGSFDVARMKGVDWKFLFNDCLGLVVRSDHALASTRDIDFASLAEERFVFIAESESPNLYRLIQRICAARGFTPHNISWVDNIDAALMEIRTNLAIGVMSRSCCQYYAQDLSFIELEGEDTQCFGSLAWLKEGNNPAVPLFLSLLDEYLANMAESSAN